MEIPCPASSFKKKLDPSILIHKRTQNNNFLTGEKNITKSTVSTSPPTHDFIVAALCSTF